jgi:hypothetical protein
MREQYIRRRRDVVASSLRIEQKYKNIWNQADFNVKRAVHQITKKQAGQLSLI